MLQQIAAAVEIDTEHYMTVGRKGTSADIHVAEKWQEWVKAVVTQYVSKNFFNLEK
jgi:hypothetical protein